MRIILLGAPGAGKGTQAQFLCEKLHIPKISSGDMLRAERDSGTSIGQSIKEMIKAGTLVPDQIIIELINKRIQEPDCDQGFLFDGFPRTVAQAQALEKVLQDNRLNIDGVIYLNVPDEEIITRMSGRRVHAASGRTYHINFNPPKVQDKDDETGEPLVQREDDKPEVVRHRLDIYHRETMPLIDFYKDKMIEIDGKNKGVKAIQEEIDRVIKNLSKQERKGS